MRSKADFDLRLLDRDSLQESDQRHGDVALNANIHTGRNSRWPIAISRCGTACQMS